jgi:hypothetical protein
MRVGNVSRTKTQDEPMTRWGQFWRFRDYLSA